MYAFGYHKIEHTLEVLKSFINDMVIKLTENYTASPNLNKIDYLKVLLSTGFYLGICNILKDHDIPEPPDEVAEIRM